MSTVETRSTRVAVFIDFDNVEIGVKSTIGTQFDIGLVLEAIKERGEIVTKIAYSDWKRAGDYSRLLTQHAIRMVQRNVTPGGDKNGADITMALDALEMAFTHDHINAFVIVGGDSDFISLVEKLKQYGRKVIVVGGRQFTSVTMQRNCHEFIAYENLLGSRAGSGRAHDRGRPLANAEIGKALPLVRRALKVLSEREVTPQLGLLKSTLLQLDSTFSERDYGASSFRDFMEKVAAAGVVTLRHAGRSMLVEAIEDSASEGEPMAPQPLVPSPEVPADVHASGTDEDVEEAPSPSPMSMQDGVKAVQEAFAGATRWPMYVRQAKQVLKNTLDGFDERKYGFASVVDLLRAAGKEGVLRIERDRQGAIRVFPGPQLTQKDASGGTVSTAEPLDVEEPMVAGELVSVEDVIEIDERSVTIEAEPVADAPIVEVAPAELVGGLELDEDEPDPDDVNGNVAGVATHEFMTAVAATRKRKAPAGRGKSGPKAAASAPRRGARKSTRRQKADAR